MEHIDHLIQRVDNLRVVLGIDQGDYDKHGVNRRASFNRKPEDAQLWADLEAAEAELESWIGQQPVYHLRQYGDVTKAELDRYSATGDINGLTEAETNETASVKGLINTSPSKRTWVELPPETILEEANKQLSPKLFAMGAAWASVQLEALNK